MMAATGAVAARPCLRILVTTVQGAPMILTLPCKTHTKLKVLVTTTWCFLNARCTERTVRTNYSIAPTYNSTQYETEDVSIYFTA
jgi:hypothetical protein